MLNNPLDTLMQEITQTARWRCRFPAPNRVWVQGADGLWSSHRWGEGEKAKYEREVLGQET